MNCKCKQFLVYDEIPKCASNWSKSLLLIQRFIWWKCRYSDPFKVYLTVQLVYTMRVQYYVLYTVGVQLHQYIDIVGCVHKSGTRKTSVGFFRMCAKCVFSIAIEMYSGVFDAWHNYVYPHTRNQTCVCINVSYKFISRCTYVS